MPTVKATKVPARRVASDDFVVTVLGEEYRPHAGEWVEFRGRLSMGQYLAMLGLMKMSGLENLSPAEISALDLSESMAKLAEMLARSIVAWSWTDDAGQPYPSPPVPENLTDLSIEELSYLVGRAAGGATEAESKNGGSPSI